MAIGIVSDDDLAKELANLYPSKSPTPFTKPEAEVVEVKHGGRREGDVETPDALRKLVGEEYALNGRQAGLELAEELGISPQSASAYGVGATSCASYNEPSTSILTHIRASKERVLKKAHEKLEGALDSITQEKLDNLDAKDASAVAKDMAGVVKSLTPEESDKPVDNGPKFVIFAPQFVREEKFDIIEVDK